MKINKNKTALLIMDYQNDLVHEKGKIASFGIAKHAKEQNSIENIKKLLDKARSSRIKVIFIKVEYEEGYPELTNAKAPKYVITPEYNAVIKGTWGAEIYETLKPLEGERVFSKSRTNPFTNPNFGKELQGLETLILAGVATNFVVEATARTAADLDYNIIIAEDCCASMNKEMHEFSIKNILLNLGIISNSKEICNAL